MEKKNICNKLKIAESCKKETEWNKIWMKWTQNEISVVHGYVNVFGLYLFIVWFTSYYHISKFQQGSAS